MHKQNRAIGGCHMVMLTTACFMMLGVKICYMILSNDLFAKLTWNPRSQVAAQPYEYQAQISNCIDDHSKLKIAIVGFGNFGQFLAKTLIRQGHTVLAYSRSDYSDVAQKLGVSYFSDGDDLCEEHPEVILLCTSILSTENVLKSLPVHRLKRSTLFVDVLSVKEFPRNLFLQHLPPDFDILCTHPMFGPESGKNGWNGLPFLFDKVRVGSSKNAKRGLISKVSGGYNLPILRRWSLTVFEH